MPADEEQSEERPLAYDVQAEDRTPAQLISGLRGSGFNGSAAISGTPQHTGTPGHAELTQRVANHFRRLGVADEVRFNQGVNRIYGAGPGGVQGMSLSNRQPDLAIRLGQRVLTFEVASRTQLQGSGARGLHTAIRDTSEAAQRLRVRQSSVLLNATSLPPNAATRIMSATERIVAGLNYFRRPALGLEIAGHAYNVYSSGDRIMAGAQAVGCMAAARTGALWGVRAGAAGGAFFGPLGAAVGGLGGALAGGIIGSFAGDYFASRGGGAGRVNAEQQMGGVDLGGSLHFLDHLPTMTGVLIDPIVGVAMAASQGADGREPGPLAELTAHDFAVILKVEFFNSGRGEFSLDPADPLDPFGPYQKKVFRPGFLAGTDIGELLFRADVLLKRLSLGLEVPPLDGWRSPFDLGTSDHAVHRLWIVPAKMTVELVSHPGHPSAKCIRLGNVQLAVLACAMVADPTAPSGLRDIPTEDARDLAFMMAAQCTQRMNELIKYYPTLERLYKVYQAVALCGAMRQLGTTIDYAWVELNGVPLFETPGKVATLRNSRDRVTQNGAEQITSTHTLMGGCVLASDDANFEIQEVVDDTAHLGDLFRSMRHNAGEASVPQCYRLGQRLDEDPSSVEAMRTELEREAPIFNLDIPLPPVEGYASAVPLPFVAQVGSLCAVCQCPLSTDAIGEANGTDPIRFQTILGVPLCSRVHPHTHFVGPLFRLSKYQPCASCGEAIRAGPILTVRSTEGPARDYHEGCAPLEDVQRARDSQSTRDDELQEAVIQLQALEEGGNMLGGTFADAHTTRLLRFSSGSEMVDLQRALNDSMVGTAPVETGDVDELQLQAALQVSMQPSTVRQKSSEIEAALAASVGYGKFSSSDDPELQLALAASLSDANIGGGDDAELSAALAASLVDLQAPVASTARAQASEMGQTGPELESAFVEPGAVPTSSEPELEAALAASLRDAGHSSPGLTEDPDLAAALAASRADVTVQAEEHEDHELQAALAMSMAEDLETKRKRRELALAAAEKRARQ